MKELMEKYNAWEEEVKASDKDLLMLARIENNWYLVGNKRADLIQTFGIIVDDGAGLRSEYTYSAEHPDTDCPYMGAIIKKDKKLIIQSKDDLYAFGLKDVPPPVKAFCMYWRAGRLHGFVFFHNEAKSIEVIYQVTAEPRDAITCYMENMFGITAAKTTDMEGDEGNG